MSEQVEFSAEDLRDNLLQAVKQNRKRFLWMGIALLILGVLAILFPVAASITTKIWVGWALLIAGAFMLHHAFKSKSWGDALGIGFLSLLNLAAGVWLAFFPLTGLLTLTVFLAVVFIAEGAIKIVSAMRARGQKGWGWLIFSGAASLILGIMLVMGLPGTALWAIGLMVGLNFFSTGITLIALSRAIPKD